MVTWLYVFEPMLSQNMGQGHLSHDKHKAELSHNEKELGQDVLFKDMPPTVPNQSLPYSSTTSQ